MTPYASMTEAAEAFIAYRGRLGYIDRMVAHYTRSLAHYLDGRAPGAALTGDGIMAWAGTGKAAPFFRIGQIRRFADWMKQRDERTRIPESFLSPYPSPFRKPPYIYSPEEVNALMRAAACRNARTGPPPPVHAITAYVGLLACTGLRMGEAMRLEDGDVDLEEGVLHVRKSKNLPLRLVPLHESAVAELRRYRAYRKRKHPRPRANTFFLSHRGDPFAYSTVLHRFRMLLRRAGVPFRTHWCRPRLTDLRHTFACRHLQRHHEEGKNMHCAIADLAVYLGHAEIEHTYWYLTGIPELMHRCGERFERHVEEGRKGDRR